MKVLIVDDDRSSRMMLQKLLGRWGYTCETAEDGEEALNKLSSPDGPKIAILDWMMPRVDGIEVCRRVRDAEWRVQNYVYIILLTSKSTREDLLAGLRAGADDYVSKPFDRYELEMRLNVGKRIIELQESYRAIQEELHHQATHDSMTGVFNKAAICDHLTREMNRAARGGNRLAIGMLDLDHFKGVNDTYGHRAGDDVLKEFVRRVLAASRPYDRLGRVGGEEFLLVVPDADPSDLPAAFERIRASIAADPMTSHEHELKVTVSVGVQTLEPDMTLDSFLHAADKLLYRAKEEGRDRVVLSERAE